jgi:hypothetical protein
LALARRSPRDARAVRPPGRLSRRLRPTIYTEAARAIRAARSGGKPDPAVTFPSVDDGVAGVAFIEAAVRSSAAGGSWEKV